MIKKMFQASTHLLEVQLSTFHTSGGLSRRVKVVTGSSHVMKLKTVDFFSKLRQLDQPTQWVNSRFQESPCVSMPIGTPVTRWASVAFGAGLGIGSAYTECSTKFDGSSKKHLISQIIIYAVCAVALKWIMRQRYAETSKIMPAGIVAGIR